MSNQNGRPRKINHDAVVELAKQGLTPTQIAKQVGCSQPCASSIMRANGFGLGMTGGSNRKARADAQKVIDHIISSGGTLKEALLELDVDVCAQTVRNLANEQGLDLTLYRHFKLQRGVWVVPRPYQTKGKASKPLPVPVQCIHCGFEKEVHYLTFTGTRPTACPKCGAG